jgi:hydrogenase maturation protease
MPPERFSTTYHVHDRKEYAGMNILVLAYGNPLRCDDGLGWHAARQLSSRLTADSQVLTCHQLTPELAEDISGADAVFFIDAGRGGEPGELTCRPVSPGNEAVRFSHDCSPEVLLALCRQLYGECPPAFAVSVCGQSFLHGESLSPCVAATLPRLTAVVTEMARKFHHGH